MWQIIKDNYIVMLIVAAVLATLFAFCSCATPQGGTLPKVSEHGKDVANLFESLPKNFNFLILVFVGGLIFWGYSKSKQGWVVPSASVGGIVLMVVFAKYATWIAAIVLVVALGLFIWKALEYQRERNENAKEKK